ncbi:hypothetical protein ACQJBY_041954 [Aegilops geniculata]
MDKLLYVQKGKEKPARVKIGEGTHWSWRTRQYRQCNIAPDVVDQKDREICQFCGLRNGAQMELRRAIANKTPGGQCHLKLDYESLIRSYLELHGLPEYADEKQKNEMEKEIIEKDKDRYHREDGACWCLKNLGIRAFVGNTPYVHRLGIDDYHLYPRMPAEDVWTYVEEGRAVMCKVLCGQEFYELEADEIYAWIPQYDGEKKKFVEMPEKHQVVLIGNGNAGPELDFEQ